ncbi:MAG: hypothetical protein HZB37_07625 [Planctomycetes bacterium]|nr:hypothetical protein [Planctomycetota bacterium]
MIKFGALPENINHFLPDVREYLNKHPGVLFAYLFGRLKSNGEDVGNISSLM